MAISNSSSQTRTRRLCANTRKAPSNVCSPLPRPPAELIEQTRRLMERTIEFVGFDDVDHAEFDDSLRKIRPASLDVRPAMTGNEPGIAFVSGLVQKPLLTQDEERYLFLRMNFLKSRAERNRRLLDLRQPDRIVIEQIMADLDEAQRLRNQIVEGNLRLVVAIARKLSSALDRMSELISEGMAPLIRAVELFDVGLGNRFSTYATWAVRNQMLRRLKKIGSILEVSPGEDAPSLENLPDQRNSPVFEEFLSQSQMRTVHRLLFSLSERERSIVCARFGLQGQPRGQSLAVIAGQVGLCKERVRQILNRSLEKLRLNMVQ